MTQLHARAGRKRRRTGRNPTTAEPAQSESAASEPAPSLACHVPKNSSTRRESRPVRSRPRSRRAVGAARRSAASRSSGAGHAAGSDVAAAATFCGSSSGRKTRQRRDAGRQPMLLKRLRLFWFVPLTLRWAGGAARRARRLRLVTERAADAVPLVAAVDAEVEEEAAAALAVHVHLGENDLDDADDGAAARRVLAHEHDLSANCAHLASKRP